jgi:CHAD domain-containing protein
MPGPDVRLTPPPGFRLPDLSDPDAGVSAVREELRQFVTTYFDTHDLRLARAGVTLRHRSDETWTLQLPAASGAAAPESHFGGTGLAPPDEALDLVRALARTAPVEAVSRVRTLRRRLELRDRDGAAIAEVVDDEVSVLDGEYVASRYRELAVHPVSDTNGTASRVVDRLREAGAGAPDPLPMVARALGPRALDPPDVRPGPLDHAPSAGDVVRNAIAGSVVRLLAHDPGVRLGDDPEDVHQARVATRRLRSDLRTFRTLIDPAWTTEVRAELRWLGDALGAVRDREVMLDRLRAGAAQLALADQEPAQRIVRWLLDEWDVMRRALLDAIRSARYLALLERLVAASQQPPLVDTAVEPAADVLPALARGPWVHLRQSVDALPDDPSDAELHEVRIRAKRCRYASEAVTAVVGKPARRFAQEIATLQDVLGEHQDATVAERWLRDTARAGGRETFVAGELAAFARADAASARAEWPEAWRRARRKQLRSWM